MVVVTLHRLVLVVELLHRRVAYSLNSSCMFSAVAFQSSPSTPCHTPSNLTSLSPEAQIEALKVENSKLKVALASRLD